VFPNTHQTIGGGRKRVNLDRKTASREESALALLKFEGRQGERQKKRGRGHHGRIKNGSFFGLE